MLPLRKFDKKKKPNILWFANICFEIICNSEIKFVAGLWHVGGFLRVLPVFSINKTDHHDITEILLKVALSTINQPKYCMYIFLYNDIILIVLLDNFKMPFHFKYFINKLKWI